MKVYSKITRIREWLSWFAEQYPQKCTYCNGPIDPTAFLKGDKTDGVTIHHADHNRANNHPSNRKIYHRSCHQKYHKNLEEKVHVDLLVPA